MKTITKIQAVEHEDLVNLFSSALYGNPYMGASYSQEFYGQHCTVNENDCYEDKIAKILLSGGTIEVEDYEAEDADEHYGTLEAKYNGECMSYKVSLNDIANGIANALDFGGYESRCAKDLIYQPGDFDLEEGYSLLQFIVFGEIIYG